jgi:hypothetical protein
VKYGDEKLLKGEEVFCRKTRRNVLNRQIPASLTASDFRNTYAIIGFCGIDRRTRPLHYDAEMFAKEIEYALATGHLIPGDVLVLDGGE